MKTLTKSVLAMSAAAIALGASASAQELISNPTGVVANFDPANIGPVLTELGVVWQERADDSGKPFIAASVGGQLSFNIVPTACQGANNTNCVGMNLLALYGGANVNPQTVSAFNQRFFFVSAGALSNNAGAYISRYEIADYGIPRGNVASSIGNFVFLADSFMKEVSSGAKTVSLDGYADDMSANILNVKAAEAAGVVVADGPDASKKGYIHRAGFNEAPELVRVMMESKAATRNKIRNIAD